MSNNAKRFTKEKETKKIRKIYQTMSEMRDAMWHLPMITLDKPRFVGWQRFFVLRDDIANRKDAREFREILDMINTTVYSRTKDFSHYDIEDQPNKYSAYQHSFLRGQHLKTISHKQYEKLNEFKKKWFGECWEPRGNYKYYRFNPSYFFVYKIKRHYVTQVPVLDTELESKITELQNKIRTHNLWPKIHKIMGWKMYKAYDYNSRRFSFIDKMIKQAVQEVYLIEPIRESDKNQPVIENMDY